MFKGSSDVSETQFKIDPKTRKVTLSENPDESRSDMKQEYDMEDSYGSGSNLALDKMRKSSSLEIDMNSDGMSL
jgi:hypothetical protein